MKIVNAGTCEGRESDSGDIVTWRRREGDGAARVDSVDMLSVLLKWGIIWILNPSSLAGGVKAVFVNGVMCPDVSSSCLRGKETWRDGDVKTWGERGSEVFKR